MWGVDEVITRMSVASFPSIPLLPLYSLIAFIKSAMTDGQPGDVSYDKPVPRDPKSPAKVAQIRVHNRRREYLQRHPSYYESLDHELAGKPG